MNVLILGSGGREHALAWAIAKSPLLTKLICAPGNPGMAKLGACFAIDIMNSGDVIDLCRREKIDFVVVGPENPLVAGIIDALNGAGIKAFGPTAAAARLEGSKGFTKDLCRHHHIPTAAYERFSDAASAVAYIENHGSPLVVKADGLAAGKGVTIALSVDEAIGAVNDIFAGLFGEGGAEVVIEEYLEGEEASLFVLVDGQNIVPLASAQDHKQVFDGDRGPNTGGMGAYSPAPVLDAFMTRRAIDDIIMPTVRAMTQEGTPFQGVLYAGLMITPAGPQLIEYNVRFGDPECQALVMRLEDDLLDLLIATADGKLANRTIKWRDEAALTVVMASKGYPGQYVKNSEIKGLEQLEGDPDIAVFHAGTIMQDGRLLATGGRVLNITARGATVAAAQRRAYAAVDLIDWPQGFCRRDIGWRAIERET